MQRVLHEETRSQQNIEDITRLARPDVREGAKPDDVEADWLVRFFDRARITSDVEMQTLWARVLADEANAPGAFSRRTVDLVATLEKSEARCFSDFCSFCWVMDQLTPLIFRDDLYQTTLYRDAGIRFGSIMYLDMQTGSVVLTTAGNELAPISGATENREFFDFVCDTWRESGIGVTTDEP